MVASRVWPAVVAEASSQVWAVVVAEASFQVWTAVVAGASSQVWTAVVAEASFVWAWGVLQDAVLSVRVWWTAFCAGAFAVLCAGEPAVVFVFAFVQTVSVRRLCGRRDAVRHQRRL